MNVNPRKVCGGIVIAAVIVMVIVIIVLACVPGWTTVQPSFMDEYKSTAIPNTENNANSSNASTTDPSAPPPSTTA